MARFEDLSRIPATVITGFLGAGKTTLIQRLLENPAGRRIALIINEFGDIGMDRLVLDRGAAEGVSCDIPGCRDGDVVELANGCICCTVADEFLPTMQHLIERDDPPDHIVIETSGLALPKPLIKAFQWPDVRSRVTVDGVIAVIDTPAVAAGLFADDPAAVEALRRADPGLDHENPLEEVFTDQLQCADLVMLNKADLVDGPTMARVKADLAPRLRPGVSLLATTQAEVPGDLLLGLGAAAEDDLDARPSHHDGIDNADHHHDDFDSLAVEIPSIADPAALQAGLQKVIAAHGLLRVKGVLDVPGKPMRQVVQAVGPRIERYFDRPWRDGEARQGRLVAIALTGFDRARLSADLAALGGAG
ncbi:cobalamin biosynthesis protein CobW [Roseospirillum parvum]|uniref:Cobalamin biosynthesis protein CobW n=1 Tax=Roseospirillum parvum TaxID=83401 RepID=A0A1G8FYL5_9PROT|nr:cobalamin biosynthesis protein CobW [Roseospirillum parvum]SDH87066.1 cobalamin biosynthesis protein CobW [Roseospirillum parvum]